MHLSQSSAQTNFLVPGVCSYLRPNVRLVTSGMRFLLFTNQEARQITADLLRSTANAIAPEQDGKIFQDRVKDAVVEKVVLR